MRDYQRDKTCVWGLIACYPLSEASGGHRRRFANFQPRRARAPGLVVQKANYVTTNLVLLLLLFFIDARNTIDIICTIHSCTLR